MRIRLRINNVFLLLVILLLLLVAQLPIQAQSKYIACGGTVAGDINDENPQDYWWFVGRAGQTVKISMWGELDSGLLLADTGGYVLARSSGIGDAYLEETIEITATYTIEATRRGGESGGSAGAYQLLLNCAAPPRPTNTPQPTAAQASGGITVDGSCSLRDAITAANNDRASGGCPAGSGADTIHLQAETTLGDQLVVDSAIAIAGNGYTISGGGRTRIFVVTASGALTLQETILRDGSAQKDGPLCEGTRYSSVDGGAICNLGSLAVSDSVFSGNSVGASGVGGAIYNRRGDASISGSVFSGNSVGASGVGGAIYNGRDASISVSGSVFSGNSAKYGGAIANGGDASISVSEFSGNSAGEEGGAIYNGGDASIGGSSFLNNSPENCDGAICRHAPGGGGLRAPLQAGLANADSDSAGAVAIPAIPGDAGGSSPALDIPHEQLLAVEHVACTAQDIYAILRLKSDTAVSEHLFELLVATDGSAALADILPMPEERSLPERLFSVVTFSLIGDAATVVTGFPLASTVFHAGAELGKWIDEQFTSSSSPLYFRLTWYNTDVHPGIERYLLHATRTGPGSLRLATSLAPLSEAARWTRNAVNKDTVSTQTKNAIDLAVYWMGGDPGGFGTGSELGDRAIDLISSPAEWLLDTVVGEPAAYWAERFFTEEGNATPPVQIC